MVISLLCEKIESKTASGSDECNRAERERKQRQGRQHSSSSPGPGPVSKRPVCLPSSFDSRAYQDLQETLFHVDITELRFPDTPASYLTTLFFFFNFKI